MPRKPPYPREVRERATRMVFEQQGEYESQWQAITSIAEKFGMTAETLRSWVRQAETAGAVWLLREPRFGDAGGGGGGRPPDDPGAGDPSGGGVHWEQFERDFAAYTAVHAAAPGRERVRCASGTAESLACFSPAS